MIDQSKADILFQGEKIGSLEGAVMEPSKPQYVVAGQFGGYGLGGHEKMMTVQSFVIDPVAFKKVTDLKDNEEVTNLFQQRKPFELRMVGDHADEVQILKECWVKGYTGMVNAEDKKVAYDVKISYIG